MAKAKEHKVVIRHFTSDGVEFTGKPIPITEKSIAVLKRAFEIAAEAQEKKGEKTA